MDQPFISEVLLGRDACTESDSDWLDNIFFETKITKAKILAYQNQGIPKY